MSYGAVVRVMVVATGVRSWRTAKDRTCWSMRGVAIATATSSMNLRRYNLPLFERQPRTGRVQTRASSKSMPVYLAT